MGSHQQVYVTREQALEHLLAPLAFHASREQSHTYGQPLEHRRQRGVVLLGQYLRGRHDAGLVAVAYGDERCHERHQCLAAAHIALQEAVHLSATVHVVPHLADDPFLGTRQLEGELLGIELVEQFAHLGKAQPAVLAAAVLAVAQYAELHAEEFLKLEPVLCPAQLLGLLGEVYGMQCLR